MHNERIETFNVVTVFLEHDGKILILRRSQKTKTMKSKWAGISGYIENEDPLESALNEIREETGLTSDKLKLRQIGRTLKAVESDKPGIVWIIHPFLFESSTNLINTNWEHDSYEWVFAKEIQEYETVPKLKEALDNVLNIVEQE